MKYIIIPLIWVACLPFRIAGMVLGFVAMLLWTFSWRDARREAFMFWPSDNQWCIDPFEKGCLIGLALVLICRFATVLLCYGLELLYRYG